MAEKTDSNHWRIPIQLKFAVLFVGLTAALGAIWRVADTTSRDVQSEVSEIRDRTYPWMVEALQLDGEVVSIDFALESAVTFPTEDQIDKLKTQDASISKRFERLESIISPEHRDALDQVKAKYKAHVQAAITLVQHLVAQEDVAVDEEAEDEAAKGSTPGEAAAPSNVATPSTDELLKTAAAARTAFAEERRLLLDLAHRAMQEGLGRTDSAVGAQVQRISLISAGAALGAMLILGWTAFGVALPMRKLRDWAREVAAGRRHVAFPDLGVNDEISDLGADFRQMTDQLREFTEGLEQLVADRTADLDRRNQEMRLILDTVDQGFVTVRSDGTLDQARSAAFDRWFDAPASDTSLASHLGTRSAGFQLAFEFGMEQLVAGFLPTELCVEQMPGRLRTTEGKAFDIGYRAVMDGDAVSKLLVVLTDVTERLAEEQRAVEQAQQIALFQQATQRRAFLSAFVADTEDRLTKVCQPCVEREVLLRELHTLKGNALVCNLHHFAERIHTVEAACIDEGSIAPELAATLTNEWGPLAEQARRFLGKRGDSIVLSRNEYRRHLAALASAHVDHGIVAEVETWTDELAGDHLTALADEAQRLASKLDKVPLEVEVVGERVRIPDNAEWAVAQLSHLVRNAVDHGCRSTDELANKGATNHLRLTVVRTIDKVVFEVRDNGGGIDWDRVRSKARVAGLPAQTQTDLIDALCADELTTREEASMVSGRGVGLSSVKRACVAHGAKLIVTSQRGDGTTFMLHMPLGAHSNKPVAA